MSKTVFLFSGQGSQHPGMGRELYDQFAQVRQIYECASDILGWDVAAASFSDDPQALGATRRAQPAIFTLSLAALRCVEGNGIRPQAVAGHSLGEYAALCAAGAFTLEDGFRLIAARAEAMDHAAQSHSGAMCAILGSDEATVEAVCEATPGFVLPVNYNTPSQTVIAGESQAVDAAAGELAGRGAKTAKLAVSSAFHTSMMDGAAEELSQALGKIHFAPLQLPFYSNLTGGLLPPDTPLADYLCRHMVSPVRFVSEMAAMTSDGYDSFLELGPGRVVSGLVKRTHRGVATGNVEDLKTLEKALALGL